MIDLFPSWEPLKTMLVHFKSTTLKLQVSDYLSPTENSIFSSVSDFHSDKPSLTKHVLLVSKGVLVL